MNNSSNSRDTSNAGPTLVGFAVGALVGAGLALLLAPASGEKTRGHIASAARRWSKNTRRTLDQTREVVAELGVDARSAVEAGRDAFNQSRQNSNQARTASRSAVTD
jgi:gas vesicle protein